MTPGLVNGDSAVQRFHHDSVISHPSYLTYVLARIKIHTHTHAHTQTHTHMDSQYLSSPWECLSLNVFSKSICSVHCVCAQSRPMLCNPIDCSLPGSSVHRISQKRILEWVVISSSRRSFQPRGWTCTSWVSCVGRRVVYPQATWHALGWQSVLHNITDME